MKLQMMTEKTINRTSMWKKKCLLKGRGGGGEGEEKKKKEEEDEEEEEGEGEE
jgi:hypothetical protein